MSNAFIYHEVSLAPRERLVELDEIGERTSGRGPLLYTEFEEFAKHFLRDADPVGATEGLEVPGRMPRLTDGGRPAFATSANVNTLMPEDVNRFRSLVQRRGPDGQRPPAGWQRIWVGQYYELWRRGAGPEVVAHQPAPKSGCAELRRLARRARAVDGRLAAARTPPITRLLPAEEALPFGWAAFPDGSGLVQTVGPGIVSGSVKVPRTGRYEIWFEGAFGRPVEVRIDGREVGKAQDELAQPTNWIELNELRLEAGRHRIELVRGGGTLAPGNGDGRRLIGPLALRPKGDLSRIATVPPRRWRNLCADALAWAEVIRPGA